MLTLEQATAGAAKISDALFTSLEKMPKFLRLKTWTDDEREGYIARIWLDANEKVCPKRGSKRRQQKNEISPYRLSRFCDWYRRGTSSLCP